LSEALLEVSDLLCERDDRLLFQGLSFSVTSGDVVQIEGPNGSGKTSLLRILCGLSDHFEGAISWRQQPIGKVRQAFYAELLYQGHQAGIKSVLTAQENLQWSGVLHEDISIEQINAALAKVGLQGFEDVPCYSLSAGQQRRVGLARLFLTAAPLWILDEPFTAIDKSGVAELEKVIAQHALNGGSVILTTHHELHLDVSVRKVKLGEAALA